MALYLKNNAASLTLIICFRSSNNTCFWRQTVCSQYFKVIFTRIFTSMRSGNGIVYVFRNGSVFKAFNFALYIRILRFYPSGIGHTSVLIPQPHS